MRNPGRPKGEKKRRIIAVRLDQETRRILDIIQTERPAFNISEYVRTHIRQDFLEGREEAMIRLEMAELNLKEARLKGKMFDLAGRYDRLKAKKQVVEAQKAVFGTDTKLSQSHPLSTTN